MTIKSIIRCHVLDKHDWRQGDGYAICRDCGAVKFLGWDAQSAPDEAHD